MKPKPNDNPADPAAEFEAMAKRVADQLPVSIPNDGQIHCLPELAEPHREKAFALSMDELRARLMNPPQKIQEELASSLVNAAFNLRLSPGRKLDNVGVLYGAAKALQATLAQGDATARATAIKNIMASMVASNCLYLQLLDFLIQRIDDKQLSPGDLHAHLRGRLEVEDHLLRVIETMHVVHNLPGIQSGVRVTTGDNAAVHVQQLNVNPAAKEDSP